MGRIIRKNFVVSVIMARVYVAEERHILMDVGWLAELI